MPAHGIARSLTGNVALTKERPGLLSTTTIDGSAPIAVRAAARPLPASPPFVPPVMCKEVVDWGCPRDTSAHATAAATAYLEVHSGVPPHHEGGDGCPPVPTVRPTDVGHHPPIRHY